MAETNGQWSETKPVTTEIILMACMMQEKVKEMTKKTYEQYDAIEYREIVNVLPWPLFIKVQVGVNEYIHVMIRVFYVNILQPLKMLVVGVQENL
ncbi:PREDICTED: cystatin-A5-like [Poecilia mexicana]|uniref:cystatin-A5-like n=1 Tax=Poecilia mexicana TaxID=48701 RepID=UPI00072E6053|nr:PREDICTED: cystatin-A5-like [Poecilia mexicana]